MSTQPSIITIRVPASTSNLGSGFDVLGLGLNMYLELSMELDTGRIEVLSQGDGAEKLPTDETNLIASEILDYAPELRDRGFRIRTQSNIPLTRGFGSSASAIVGAIALAQLAQGKPIDRQEILQISTAKEGHPDNVSASIFGGLTVNADLPQGVQSHRIAVPSSIQLVGIVPHQEISTAAARKALPTCYERPDVVFNLQRLSFLVVGLLQNNADMIRAGLQDRLHQSYRCDLLPPMHTAIHNMNNTDGCIQAFVSGAGPGIVAFVQGNADAIAQAGVQPFEDAGIHATIQPISVDNDGIVQM